MCPENAEPCKAIELNMFVTLASEGHFPLRSIMKITLKTAPFTNKSKIFLKLIYLSVQDLFLHATPGNHFEHISLLFAMRRWFGCYLYLRICEKVLKFTVHKFEKR